MMSDHFALFGLPRRFDLDEAALQSRYLELARQTHPDFAGSDPEAQVRAMSLSAAVNEAHRILSDPEERANYLLGLLGGPTADDDKSLPGGFLEEMMSLREDLADAQAAGDRARVNEIRASATAQAKRRLAQIGDMFSQPSNLPAIRLELNALRYLGRALESP